MTKKQKKVSYNIVVGALLIASLAWVVSRFVHLGNVEFTDNAQIKQQIVPIHSRVQGFVKAIHFEEYQEVKKGDTLLIIDDIEYRYRLAQATADYSRAITGKKAMGTSVLTAKSNIEVTEAGIEESRVRMENAQKEFQRYTELLEQKAVTKQQYDNIKTNYEAAQARYEQVLRQKNTTSLVKDEQTLRLDQTDAQIQLAEAALELARLNLSYTVITAPCDGVAGRKMIEEGQLIQPGQSVLDLVNEEEIWIIANYKETQTSNIKEGSVVVIVVDAVPDKVYKGVVKAISGATGASFSLFPQDNSAGNFVKIAQRIPIRIEFSNNPGDDMDLLRAGMNVECEVIY
ncbi:HlyD family secretion protein [Draconibacterium orientale]|uniref:HlyD family secretion protein n=1 Tax=Draconibacterium orientale TaxID=1168034 RepID=UPI002A0A6E35|nr:HlyD family secretion protein [Draconibacterium orientale]